MKIFVLGGTHSGKTPLARRIMATAGATHIGASAWVREGFRDPEHDEDRAAFTEAITAFALSRLKVDPQISAAHLARKIGAAGEHVVIEGVRNPYDFAVTFDPRVDRVIFLDYRGPDQTRPTRFEADGLEIIKAYVSWCIGMGLMTPDRFTEARFAEFGVEGDPRPGTLEKVIVDFVATLPPPGELLGAVPREVHAQVPSFRARVRAEHLYGMDPARVGQLRDCNVFSIASYAGSAPTFQIVLDDGAVFSYLPPSALLVDDARPPELELADLVYHDCKSTLVCVHIFEALRGHVLCYFKRKDLWLGGTYLFSVDWYTTNEMLHGVALDNGQLALLPSHKIKFGDHPPGFEPYKKIRREWKVSVD